MPQIFHPFFAKKATTISATQSINPEKAIVIRILARLNQAANAK